MVSNAERKVPGWCESSVVHAVRKALIWLECAPRRQRAWEREDAKRLAQFEAAIAAVPMQEEVIVDYLADLLRDGRGDDFDTLAALVPDALVNRAGDLYVDGCTPLSG